MRSRFPLGILLVLTLARLFWPAPGPAAEAAGRSTEPVVVLLTAPRAGELANIVNLVEKGLLDVPRLRVLGIYHRDELEDYSDSQGYCAGNDWMDLRRLDCRLSEGDVYRQNDCSDEFAELFRESVGAIFTGGPDIPPALYGQETRLTTEIEDPARHYFEISFLFHLLGSSRDPKAKPLLESRPGYVVLGLCLGMQSMNVAAGGTLIQDIPSDLYGVASFEQGLRLSPDNVHRSFYAPLFPAPDVGRAVVHPIVFVKGSAPAKRLLPVGGEVRVLSIHHQAVGKLGQGLEVLARSKDGKVIEALRHTKYPALLGVQFHPEKELLWSKSAVYREGPDSPPANHVAGWFLSDPGAEAFVKNFWKLAGELIQESARRNNS